MEAELVQGLDVTVLETVLEQGTAEARVVLARQLALLSAAEDTPSIEREQVIPILLKLAVDPERAVRAALTEELTGVEVLHPDLLFSIIASEDELAIPFLSSTPALNKWHMMAVLRVGDEARQCAVAGRLDITAEAAAYVIKSGPSQVALALMNNPVVQLSPQDLHALYARFGNTPEIVERLLAHPQLPVDIRILQARRAATRMRQLLAERGWLPANDASDLVADAEENAIMQVLIESDLEQLVKAVAFLASKQMLTPSMILRAACLGETRVVEATLAHLAGIAPHKAEATIYTRGGMRSIVSKAGLPSGCAGVLIAFADVAAEAREEEVELSRDAFGRRILEALMTRYEGLSAQERARQIAYVSKLGDEKVRKIAKQLRSDLQRAA